MIERRGSDEFGSRAASSIPPRMCSPDPWIEFPDPRIEFADTDCG